VRTGRLLAETAGFGALGAALGAAAFAGPRELVAGLAVLGALALPALAWLVVRDGGRASRPVVAFFAGAVVVRAGVALLVEYGAPSHYFSLDHGRYAYVGWQLAEHWAGRAALPDLLTEKSGYYVWNALVFTVVGHAPLAVALSNAVVGGLCVVLAYRIARDLAGHRAARIAAGLTAFCPSLVLWSSLNLRDAFAMLSILAALRGTQRLQSGPSAAGLLLLAGGVLWLSQLREYLVLLLLLSVAAGLAVPRTRAFVVPVLLAAAFGGGLAAGVIQAPVAELTEGVSFEALDRHRKNLAIGESVYFGDADVSTPGAAARFLPVGVAYFLLGPFPWEMGGARQWMTLPEMLVWYALLPQVFFGLRHLLRTRFAAVLPLLSFAVLTTVSYALVESNLGTAYRHRAQVLVLYLVFAAVGLATRRAPAAATEREPEAGERAPGAGRSCEAPA